MPKREHEKQAFYMEVTGMEGVTVSMALKQALRRQACRSCRDNVEHEEQELLAP